MSPTHPFPIKSVAEQLRQSVNLIETLVAKCPPDWLNWRPAPNEWSVQENIGHLIAADIGGFVERIQLIISDVGGEIPKFNPNQVAAERNDNARSIDSLLNEFRQGRNQHCDWLESVDPATITRTANYPGVGVFQASDFIYEWPYHDYSHLQQMSEVLQAIIWPNLTPTMQKALSR